MDYTTIHHIEEGDRDYRMAVNYEGETPDARDISEKYRPAETILGVTDPSEAMRMAQGEVVNEMQNGRHMVHSAMPTDLLEIHEDGDVRWVLVESIGFSEVDVEGEVEPKREPPHQHAMASR